MSRASANGSAALRVNAAKSFVTSAGHADVVSFYSTYETQVTALLDRSIDVTWNSPLPWVDALSQSERLYRVY